MLINMVLPGAVSLARLPAEYQEVEYIESSGTQYINTGFNPNNNTRLVMDFKMVSTIAQSNVWMFFGATNAAESICYMGGKHSGSSWKYAQYYNTAYVQTSGTTQTDWVTRSVVDQNKNTTKWAGETLTMTNAAFSVAFPIYLFAANRGGTAQYISSLYLYSCQIYDNGTLIRDFVPCYRKADDAIGLYDIANDVFYGNAGSGAFTKGEDVGGTTIPSVPPSTGDFAFTYSGNYTDNRVDGVGTVRLNTSGTLTVTGSPVTVSATIVGAGGGAALYYYSNNLYYGATGGGGGIQTVEVTLEAGTYDIVIGTSGVAANSTSDITAGNGGNTTAFDKTSTGGNGGQVGYQSSATKAGTGGTPNGSAGSVNRNLSKDGNLSGGSPNGGAVVGGVPQPGGDGYVELTFS